MPFPLMSREKIPFDKSGPLSYGSKADGYFLLDTCTMIDKKFKKKKEREKKVQTRRAEHTKAYDAEMNLFKASDFYDAGERQSAAYYLHKALNVKPGWLPALRLKAQMAMDAIDFKGAVSCFEAIIQKDGKDLDARFYLGNCLLRLDKKEEGFKAFERFLEGMKGVKARGHLQEKQKLARQCLKEAGKTERQQNIPEGYTPLNLTPLFRGEKADTGVMAAHKQEPVRTAQREPPSPVPLLDLAPFADQGLINIHVPVHIRDSEDDFAGRINPANPDDPVDYRLRLQYQHLRLVREYDELLCLEHLRGVDHYWYQVETVTGVLKRLRGRVLLADEVGLGKTIEAGMIIKEYMLRGMVKKAIVLAPPTLVSQWQEEMASKFDIPFATPEDEGFRKDPERFWREQDLVIASINTAKAQKHFDTITDIDYDLVVVDEAHYLRNKRTLNHRLVNAIRKRFLLLLSATPVQNNLLELYNLITLLQPGLLSTEAAFKQQYVRRGNLRAPNNPEQLRRLLREVMIRNTRAMVDVKLPKRFAATIYVSPTDEERGIYDTLSDCTRLLYQQSGEQDRFLIRNLQMAAGSSPFALRDSVGNLLKRLRGTDSPFVKALSDIENRLKSVPNTSKGDQLLGLIAQNSERKIVFVRHLKTLEYLSTLFDSRGISHVVFSGAMTPREKDASIDAFRRDVPILLSTETGGEGRNIQFCNTLINFDLPWNPMRLEQRIGRIHRIGQERDVFVFNLCLKGSIEDYMMRILDDKIHMFELVIGEIDTILGNLESDRDFGSIILDLWVQSSTEQQRKENFDRLGETILEAKKTYEKTKTLDEALFGDGYEV